jgi:hypothetical protein
LVVALSAARPGDYRLDELHVDLHVMAWALLLVTLPPSRVALVSLRGWESIHVEPLEDSPHAGRTDLDVVIPPQVHRDLHRPEVVMLSQMDDLLHHLGLCDRRAVQRRTGAIFEALESLVFVPAFPPIEDVAADAVVAARGRHIPADLLSVAQHGQAPVRPPD